MNDAQNAFHRYDTHSLVAAATALQPRLIERMAETDEIRRLPKATVADLKEAGLMTALVPKEYGGAGVDFRTFFDIVQELGRADGSVAWTYAVLCCGSWMVATFFPESVSKEVFQSGNPLTSAVVAPTRLTARIVDGGIQIEDGQWTFNTGIHHAGWNIVGIPIMGPQGTPIDVLSGFVSTEQLTVVYDWNALGLRGSGSCTVIGKNLFIPDSRLASHRKILLDEFPADRASQSPLYDQPVVPTVMIAMASPSIAIARGALEKFLALSSERQIAMTFYRKQSEAPVTHLQVAEASAKIDAAETITRRSIGEIEAAAASRQRLTREQRARIWRDTGFACRLAWEAMDLLAAASGGSFARDTNPINHSWRDVRVATAHAGLCTATTYEIYGRVLCGLSSGTPLLPD
jgi:alkylation response protein AidB-like acyl-CoA dehydrogenase